jgi:hypothetical protein
MGFGRGQAIQVIEFNHALLPHVPLKIWWERSRVGSIPTLGTIYQGAAAMQPFCFRFRHITVADGFRHRWRRDGEFARHPPKSIAALQRRELPEATHTSHLPSWLNFLQSGHPQFRTPGKNT